MTIKLSSVFDYALKAFLCIGTVFYIPMHSGTGDPVEWGYMVQELFFRYGVVFLFAISCMIPGKRQLAFKSFPLLVISILLTSLLLGFHVGFRSGILNIFMALVFYKIVYEQLEITRLKTFAWWFGWLLMLNLIWCVLQWVGHDMLFTAMDGGVSGKMDQIVGFMRLKVHLGVLAAILAPMVICYAPAFLLCIVPLVIFSQSSTSALALIIGCLIMGFFRFKNVAIFILSCLCVAFGVWFIFFFDMPGGQFGERFKVWEVVLGMSLKQALLIGSGVGHFATLNFTTIQGNGKPEVWQWVHNEFLQSFYEFGVLGVSCIVAYIVSMHKKAQELMNDKAVLALYASFVSIIILSCVQFPFHLGRFVPIMLFLMASLHARLEEPKYA